MPTPQISFTQIPANIRTPGVFIQISNALANNATEQQEILIIAPKGNAAADKIIKTPTADVALEEFGIDSLAYKMVKTAFDQNKFMPISVLTVDLDDGPYGDEGDLAPSLAVIGEKQFHYIISAFSGFADQKQVADFLKNRYSATEQIPGIAFSGTKGTSSSVIVSPNNSQFLLKLGINDLKSRQFPITTANAEIGAEYDNNAIITTAYAAQVAASLSIDPARPLQTLELVGIFSTATTEWTQAERNTLLHSGVATYKVSSSGAVFIDRAITTYTENANGVADDSYLDITTIATAMFFRFKQRARILSLYPRHKLAKDGTNFAPGQAVLTPTLFKAALFELYANLEAAGIVQDFENYKQTFVVGINANDPTRIDYNDQPIFVNGLAIVAGLIQFRKK